MPIRKPIPQIMQIEVWKRDGWYCRYCGAPVFFAPALKKLNIISPGHGYFHPNGKKDLMMDMFQWQWASVDHVRPFSKGGADTLDNFVTACWKCNLNFGNSEDKPAPNEIISSPTGWDGFYSLYKLLP